MKCYELERFAEERFFSMAHLYVPDSQMPQSRVQKWTLMQHHGAPTRVLDWTSSPYVAAYFAVDKDHGADGAVFMAHIATSILCADTTWLGDSEAGVLYRTNPTRAVDRIVAQQAYLGFCTDIRLCHDEPISRRAAELDLQNPGPLSHAEKWVIPARHKVEFLRQLHTMNVTGASLFPGADGIGRAVSVALSEAALGG